MDLQSEFANLFLQRKPAEMLVFLKKGEDHNYATEVSKGVDCTYSHTIKVLDKFKDFGLVEFEKEGRIKLIKLTEEGQDIAHDLEGLLRKFERKEEEMDTDSEEDDEEENEGDEEE
ncbi:MAG: winged helix DNA-binding protein [Candidatus Aenigmatarchaeota archaeon]